MSAVVHINGFPGVGKLSVARALARLTGARLVDNHTLMNPASALFDRRQRLHGELRGAIRKTVLDFAEKVEPGVPLIFTDALSDDAWDAGVFDDYRKLAAARQVSLRAVVLECDAIENEARLTAPGRAENGKLTNVAVLRSLRAGHALLRGTGGETLVLDVTAKEPATAAAIIHEYFELPLTLA